MKTTLKTIGLLLFAFTSLQAQWTPTANFVNLTTATNMVGIGTTTPQYKLHVQLASTGYLPSGNGQDGIVIENTNAPTLQFLSGQSSGQYIVFGDNIPNQAYIGYQHGSDIMTLNTAASYGSFKFVASTKNLMFLNGNNNGVVGIGTITPAAKLDVLGQSILIGSDQATTTTRTTATAKAGNLLTPHYTNTEEPLQILAGYSGLDNFINIGGGSSSFNAATKIKFFTAATNTTTAGTERMTIDGSGNVGIGTITPGKKLHVNGDIHLLGNLTFGTDPANPTYTFDNNPFALINGRAKTVTSFNTDLLTGAYYGENENDFTGGIPTTEDSQQAIFSLRFPNTNNNTQIQIGGDVYDDDRLYFRKFWVPNGGTVTSTWKEIATRGSNSFYGNQSILGNVGIGTATPQAKLEVYESTPLGSLINDNKLLYRLRGNSLGNQFMNNIWLRRDDNGSDWFTTRIHDGISVDVSFLTPGTDTKTWWERDPYNNIQSWGNGNQTWMTLQDGNLGIGTTTTGSHKLAVEGSIGAREVKVYTGAWADFVFDKNYQLPTLTEVENHIKTEGRLKDMPSTSEVVENGISLGEMQAKLLQKVEELTLYSIQQQKEIQVLRSELESLKNK